MLLKPAHSTRCDWAWRLLNLFPVCPSCFADEGVVALLLSFICSKCHRTALESCGPYCSWAVVDAIERTRYLDVFFLGLFVLEALLCCETIYMQVPADLLRDYNVKSSYAPMLLVQHKDMAKPILSGRCYSARKFNQCNNLYNFVWLHWSTHIFHESLWEAAASEKIKSDNSTQVYSIELNKDMLMLLLLLLNDVAACAKYVGKEYWVAFPEACWNARVGPSPVKAVTWLIFFPYTVLSHGGIQIPLVLTTIFICFLFVILLLPTLFVPTVCILFVNGIYILLYSTFLWVMCHILW